MTVREFCNKYRAGEFNAPDRDTQIEAGWFDWFCSEEELSERLKDLWEIIGEITSDFILDNFLVSISNCCPASNDPLYDTLVIAPVDESLNHEQIIGIKVNDRRENCKYVIYTGRNDYNNEVECDDISLVIAFINNWEDVLHDEVFYEKKQEREKKLREMSDQVGALLDKINGYYKSLE